MNYPNRLEIAVRVQPRRRKGAKPLKMGRNARFRFDKNSYENQVFYYRALISNSAAGLRPNCHPLISNCAEVVRKLPESCPKVVSEFLQLGFKVAGIPKWFQNGFKIQHMTKERGRARELIWSRKISPTAELEMSAL